MIPATNRRMLAIERAAHIALVFGDDPTYADNLEAALEDATDAQVEIAPDMTPEQASDFVWSIYGNAKRTWSDRPRDVLLLGLVRFGEITEYERRQLTPA